MAIDDIYCKACGEFTWVYSDKDEWYCSLCHCEVRSEFIYERILENETKKTSM